MKKQWLSTLGLAFCLSLFSGCETGSLSVPEGEAIVSQVEAQQSEALFRAHPMPPEEKPHFSAVPFTEMVAGDTYLGFEGGLYPNSQSRPPEDHLRLGIEMAQQITPRDQRGLPHHNGKIVLLSIGFSNVTQEFCSPKSPEVDCLPWTFMGQAEVDPEVDSEHLVLANGARGGQVNDSWDEVDDPEYERVKVEILEAQGLSEPQVQAVWLKIATKQPKNSLPGENAECYQLTATTADVLRALRQRYPNLKQVYLSSRIYAGYALTDLHPEPYAYETGFAVKWLVEAQIEQTRTGQVNPATGDMNPHGAVPWVAWGPYLWADGMNPRKDGLTYLPRDFESYDLTHPGRGAEQKVGSQLLRFFKRFPATRSWFLRGE